MNERPMDERPMDERLDRILRDVLAWEAEDIAAAPTSTEMALRLRGAGAGRTAAMGRLAWVAVAGLLLAALLGALLVGGSRQAAPVLTGYEAAVLRIEDHDRSVDVVVVGVRPDGAERVIARLPGAWIRDNPAPVGAVTLGGLLALPSSRGDPSHVTWEVFDLRHPEAGPRVVPGTRQDVEQLQSSPFLTPDMRPSVFAGSGERLAMAWYPPCISSCVPDVHVTFHDGRTGGRATIDVPEEGRVLPYLPANGLGVVLGDGDVSPAIPANARVVRPDGSTTRVDAAALEPVCRMRAADGRRVAIDEHGEVTLTEGGGAGAVGAAVGGVGVPRLVVPGEASYACFAPDDSMLVLRMLSGPHSATGAVGVTTLVGPDGVPIDVPGSFAGWLAVTS